MKLIDKRTKTTVEVDDEFGARLLESGHAYEKAPAKRAAAKKDEEDGK